MGVFVRDKKRGVAVRALACILAAASGGSWGPSPARAAGSLSAIEIRCDARNVVVRSPDKADASIACEGARDAILFLASAGLDATGDIAIDLVPKLPGVAGASAAGYHEEGENRPIILVYSEFMKSETWFELPIDRSLYRSLVSHEVAHVVASRNFKVPYPSIQAKEYIAYVTMFSAMDPVLRERALSNYPGEGFEDESQMNATIYLFDPMRFGVQAYRHFLKPANGRGYLHAILSGKALIE